MRRITAPTQSLSKPLTNDQLMKQLVAVSASMCVGRSVLCQQLCHSSTNTTAGVGSSSSGSKPQPMRHSSNATLPKPSGMAASYSDFASGAGTKNTLDDVQFRVNFSSLEEAYKAQKAEAAAEAVASGKGAGPVTGTSGGLSGRLNLSAAAIAEQLEIEKDTATEILYNGYVPEGIYAVKKAILVDASTIEISEMQRHMSALLTAIAEMKAVYDANEARREAAREGRTESADAIVDAAAESKHPADLTLDDINHLRYLAVVGARLLLDKGIANRMLDDILASDPLSIDAIELRLEMCLSGPDELAKLRPLLDGLRGQPHVDPKTQLVVENDVYENCITLLGDIIFSSMIEKVQSDGEGACTVFFGKVLQTVATELFPTTRHHRTPFVEDLVAKAEALRRGEAGATEKGGGESPSSSSSSSDALSSSTRERLPVPNEFGMLIERIYDCVDEQLYHLSTFGKRELRQCVPVLQTIVSILKAFISMQANRYVPFPEAAGLMYLLRLQNALRMLGRKRECHSIGERMKRHYAQHRAELERLSTVEEVEEAEGGEGAEGKVAEVEGGVQQQKKKKTVHFAEGSFAKQFQNAWFQHVHDEVIENPEGKRDRVIALIEAFPESNIPWKILSFCLYLQNKPHDAIIACRKAIALLPSDATSVLLLGNLYLELKQHALASEIIANFKMMMEMDRLAHAEEKRRREEEALRGGGESQKEAEERAETERGVEAAKAELGSHSLSLEMDAKIKEQEDPANRQVRELHEDYLLQMRRAHMYSAKGLPPLLYTDTSLDVAFKSAVENPEFAADEHEAEHASREAFNTQEDRKASLRGMMVGSTATNITLDGNRGYRGKQGMRRTFRNMGSRDN